jgi:hypothetical protein
MYSETPPWKRDGKACPPNIMRRCEPERYELQVVRFSDPETVAQYIEARTMHDACRVALRVGEHYIDGDI